MRRFGRTHVANPAVCGGIFTYSGSAAVASPSRPSILSLIVEDAHKDTWLRVSRDSCSILHVDASPPLAKCNEKEGEIDRPREREATLK